MTKANQLIETSLEIIVFSRHEISNPAYFIADGLLERRNRYDTNQYSWDELKQIYVIGIEISSIYDLRII